MGKDVWLSCAIKSCTVFILHYYINGVMITHNYIMSFLGQQIYFMFKISRIMIHYQRSTKWIFFPKVIGLFCGLGTHLINWLCTGKKNLERKKIILPSLELRMSRLSNIVSLKSSPSPVPTFTTPICFYVNMWKSTPH